MKVLIDNGHGHDTPGKRSPKGMLSENVALFEYEFNRDVTCRLELLLIESGMPYHILVPESEDIPLSERVRRANQIHSVEPCYLVSIHANAGGGTGWEVFTSKGQTKSDEIAEVFFQEAEKAFEDFRMRKDEGDGDSDKEAQFYVLRKTTCPAVLTENFFMDHPKDLAYIISDEGRQAIAVMHFKAIKRIYESI